MADMFDRILLLPWGFGVLFVVIVAAGLTVAGITRAFNKRMDKKEGEQ